jgi:hypothetical protein
MRYLVSIMAAAAALVLIGCDTRPATSVEKMPGEVQTLLDKYGMTDRAIVESADPDQTGCVLPPVFDTGYGVYAVTFIWGRLLDSRVSPPASMDWSGTLGVSGADGVIKVICPIDFEDGEDFPVPAVDPSSADWVSKTTGDFDGLGFLLRVRETSASDAGSPRLNFKTKPFSVELPVVKLNCFAAYFPVDEAEGVAVVARRVEGFACPRGFMKGEWVPDTKNGDRGSFNGMWYDLFGVPVGSMAGAFRTDADGTRRFEGWLSGVYLTVILAELEGTWSCDDPRLCPACGEGHGRFQGKFRYLNCEKTGVMLGEFGDFSFPPGERKLPLTGIWRASCPNTGGCPGTDDRTVTNSCPGDGE